MTALIVHYLGTDAQFDPIVNPILSDDLLRREYRIPAALDFWPVLAVSAETGSAYYDPTKLITSTGGIDVTFLDRLTRLIIVANVLERQVHLAFLRPYNPNDIPAGFCSLKSLSPMPAQYVTGLLDNLTAVLRPSLTTLLPGFFSRVGGSRMAG